MSGERYPADLALTGDDFTNVRWKEVIDTAKREGYSAMWSALSESAKQAVAEDKAAEGKVLWLFADACSMMLKPERSNDPFAPIIVMEGKRSALPEDFTAADIIFFSEIVERVDDPWLQGRLADLVWLCAKPRDPKYALIAIDAYRQLSLDAETWIRGSRECWDRAIRLSLALGNGSGERLDDMQNALLGAFTGSTKEDSYLALWLGDLLDEHRLARSYVQSISEHLEVLAREFEQTGDLSRCRDYFERASCWFRKAGNTAKAAEMTVAVAEGWVREAQSRVSSENPSHMVAASFYENAIQIYRTIPRTERAAHRVDSRLAELRDHLKDSSEKSLNEMGVVTSPGVDISQLVENARKAVTGKPTVEALKAFCNLHNGINVKEARESALERLRNHPLQALFPATVMSRDGRVIAKRPGLSMSGSSSEDDEVTIRAEMIRDYTILMGIVVQGDVWPALEVLRREHRLRETDFEGLASQAPIVPKDRIRLFGKAMFAGYEGDFVTALHLLVPQIEHMVRYHLKQSCVKTTMLDLNGVENEVGLSGLMELPEVEGIFGANLSFELRALFCDPFGPNLRNELAHGLLDDDDCNSIYSIYAWWFGLRLVFNTFWNATGKTAPDCEENQGE